MSAFITIPNEQDATLQDWLNAYGYLVERDVRWLIGIVGRDLLLLNQAAIESAG